LISTGRAHGQACVDPKETIDLTSTESRLPEVKNFEAPKLVEMCLGEEREQLRTELLDFMCMYCAIHDLGFENCTGNREKSSTTLIPDPSDRAHENNTGLRQSGELALTTVGQCASYGVMSKKVGGWGVEVKYVHKLNTSSNGISYRTADLAHVPPLPCGIKNRVDFGPDERGINRDKSDGRRRPTAADNSVTQRDDVIHRRTTILSSQPGA
jgi:hypothetical protein